MRWDDDWVVLSEEKDFKGLGAPGLLRLPPFAPHSQDIFLLVVLGSLCCFLSFLLFLLLFFSSFTSSSTSSYSSSSSPSRSPPPLSLPNLPLHPPPPLLLLPYFLLLYLLIHDSSSSTLLPRPFPSHPLPYPTLLLSPPPPSAYSSFHHLLSIHLLYSSSSPSFPTRPSSDPTVERRLALLNQSHWNYYDMNMRWAKLDALILSLGRNSPLAKPHTLSCCFF